MSTRVLPGQGLDRVLVTVVGPSEDGSLVMVRDDYGNEFEINATVRGKGSGYPKTGERWIITKTGTLWVLEMMVGVPAPRTIYGTREGLHPIVSQMLEALDEQGVLVDGTTYTPAVLPEVPPETELDPDEVSEPDDYLTPEEEVMPEPDQPPISEPEGPEMPDEDPEAPDRPRAPRPPQDDDSPFASLYIVTYNLKFTVGLRGVKQDLERLATTTHAQIICLQEFGNDKRAPALNVKGWSHYRPTDRPGVDSTPIMWRTKDFVLLDKGARHISDRTYVGDEGAGPKTLKDKYGVWVRLRHRASGQVIVVVNSHLSPSVEGGGGRPTRDPDRQIRVDLYKDQITGLADIIRDFSKGGRPVFVAADYNVNFKRDREARYKFFPYATFGRVGARANWFFERSLPNIGTHGRRYIDYIVHKPNPQVRNPESRILTGYRSDHRPVMVRYRIRRKR